MRICLYIDVCPQSSFQYSLYIKNNTLKILAKCEPYLHSRDKPLSEIYCVNTPLSFDDYVF